MRRQLQGKSKALLVNKSAFTVSLAAPYPGLFVKTPQAVQLFTPVLPTFRTQKHSLQDSSCAPGPISSKIHYLEETRRDSGTAR